MTLVSAIEIFTNPYDLHFAIGKNPDNNDKYGLMIARGPEHRGKLILNGESLASKENAIETIIEVLNICIKKGKEVILKEPADSAEGLLKAVANPQNIPIEKAMNALTEQMVEQIKKELGEKEFCETCDWLVLLHENDRIAIALTGWENVIEESIGKQKSINMIERNIPRLTTEKATLFINKILKNYK